MLQTLHDISLPKENSHIQKSYFLPMFFIQYIVSFAKRVLFEGESKLICIIKALCFQQSFCDFFVGKENLFVYVVVNFLSQVIFVFLLFLGMNVC